jgi:hypothetical protein
MVVVVQGTEKGAVVSEPTSAPLTKKSTRTTPTLSLTVAAMVAVPLTVLLSAGALICTVGGVTSTLTVMGALMVTLSPKS